MTSTDRRHGSPNHSSAFYPPLPPQQQVTWRSDPNPIGHPTALDRFEEQWRSSQGRVVPIENVNSPLGYESPSRYERIYSPPPTSANAPFYVPRQYESPAYRQDTDMTGPEPVYREEPYVQVNQGPRHPPLRPSMPGYQPWQRESDIDRRDDYPRPPFDPHQPPPERLAPRPATMSPQQQYRPHPHARSARPESRSRRHNPYTESRRRRRSTSSQPKHTQKRRFTPPQHYQRLPNRPPVL